MIQNSLRSIIALSMIAALILLAGCETRTKIREYQASKGYEARCTDLELAIHAWDRLPQTIKAATIRPEARDLSPIDGDPDDVCNEALW